LNCSLPTPSTTTSSSAILNTPEILDTVLNITAEQLHFPSPVREGVANNMEIKEESATFEDHDINKKIKIENEISPSDEERRRKRRERNKVAATKCRNKKKEQTMTLMRESQSVQDLNVSLKQEILRLESEEKDLRTILAQHRAHCRKNKEECEQVEEPEHEQGEFYNFGQDINLDGGALNGVDIEDNIDKAPVDNIVMTNDICAKDVKSEFVWTMYESPDSHSDNFSYFGTNFDLVDTSCGNQSMTNRFIGVDTRFIML